jgi:hypothetical protein
MEFSLEVTREFRCARHSSCGFRGVDTQRIQNRQFSLKERAGIKSIWRRRSHHPRHAALARKLFPFAQILRPLFVRIDVEAQQGNVLRVPSQSP